MKKAVNICLLLLVTLMVGMASAKAVKVSMVGDYGAKLVSQDDENGTETWELTFGVTEGTSTYNKFDVNFTLTNVTIESITTEEGWYYSKTDDTKYVFETTKSSFAEGKHKIATIVVKKIDKEAECNIVASPKPSQEDRTCKEFHGNYYDKKGNIVTKEQYEESCADNPKTGASIPLITLGALLVGGVALIVYGKKNKRFA